jgi:hypothetical protein
MLIDSKYIKRLCFPLNGDVAIYLLTIYLEYADKELYSASKHTPVLSDFMIWHKEQGMDICQESTDKYLEWLYSDKVQSYADVLRSYIKSFCTFLHTNGYCDVISFAHKPKGKDDGRPKRVTNYYKYLGISSTADLSEIKRAFHSMVMSIHPDLNPDDPHATQRMSSLNQIYSILKDNAERTAYDVAMGFVKKEPYMDTIPNIQWHAKSFYYVKL